MFRQGDILIKKVSQIPKSATKKKDNIILRGESSGHAHRLNFGNIYNWNGSLFLDAYDDATITHEEHGTIELERGIYEVVRQRESDPIGGNLRDWSYTKD